MEKKGKIKRKGLIAVCIGLLLCSLTSPQVYGLTRTSRGGALQPHSAPGRISFEYQFQELDDAFKTDWGQIGRDFGISLATSVAGAGIGSAASAAGSSMAATASTAVTQAGYSTITATIASTAANMATQAVIRGVGMGTVGGFSSRLQGGSFTDGFTMGAAGGAAAGIGAGLGGVSRGWSTGKGIDFLPLVGTIGGGAAGYAIAGKEGMITGSIQGTMAGFSSSTGIERVYLNEGSNLDGVRITEINADGGTATVMQDNDLVFGSNVSPMAATTTTEVPIKTTFWQNKPYVEVSYRVEPVFNVGNVIRDSVSGFAVLSFQQAAATAVNYHYDSKMLRLRDKARSQEWSDERFERKAESIQDRQVLWSSIAGSAAAGLVAPVVALNSYSTDSELIGKNQDYFEGVSTMRTPTGAASPTGALKLMAKGAIRGGLSGLGSGLAVTKLVDYRDPGKQMRVQAVSSLGGRIGLYAGDSLVTRGPALALAAYDGVRGLKDRWVVNRETVDSSSYSSFQPEILRATIGGQPITEINPRAREVYTFVEETGGISEENIMSFGQAEGKRVKSGYFKGPEQTIIGEPLIDEGKGYRVVNADFERGIIELSAGEARTMAFLNNKGEIMPRHQMKYGENLTGRVVELGYKGQMVKDFDLAANTVTLVGETHPHLPSSVSGVSETVVSLNNLFETSGRPPYQMEYGQDIRGEVINFGGEEQTVVDFNPANNTVTLAKPTYSHLPGPVSGETKTVVSLNNLFETSGIKSGTYAIPSEDGSVNILDGTGEIVGRDSIDNLRKAGLKIVSAPTQLDLRGTGTFSYGGDLVSARPGLGEALSNLGSHFGRSLISVENLSSGVGEYVLYNLGPKYEGGLSVRGALFSTFAQGAAQMLAQHSLSRFESFYMTPSQRNLYQADLDRIDSNLAVVKAKRDVSEEEIDNFQKNLSQSEKEKFFAFELAAGVDFKPTGEQLKNEDKIAERIRNENIGGLSDAEERETIRTVLAERKVADSLPGNYRHYGDVFLHQAGQGMRQVSLDVLTSGVTASLSGASWRRPSNSGVMAKNRQELEKKLAKQQIDMAARDYLAGGVIMPALSGAIQGFAGHWHRPGKLDELRAEVEGKLGVKESLSQPSYAAVGPLEWKADKGSLYQGAYHAGNALAGALIGIGDANLTIWRDYHSFGYPGDDPGVIAFSNYLGGLDSIGKAVRSENYFTSGYATNIYTNQFKSYFKGAVTAPAFSAKLFGHRQSYLNRVVEPEIIIRGEKIELASDFTTISQLEAAVEEAEQEGRKPMIDVDYVRSQFGVGEDINRGELERVLNSDESRQLVAGLYNLNLIKHDFTVEQRADLWMRYDSLPANFSHSELLEVVKKEHPILAQGGLSRLISEEDGGVRVESGFAGPAWRFANPHAVGPSTTMRLFANKGYRGPLPLTSQYNTYKERINMPLYRIYQNQDQSSGEIVGAPLDPKYRDLNTFIADTGAGMTDTGITETGGFKPVSMIHQPQS